MKLMVIISRTFILIPGLILAAEILVGQVTEDSASGYHLNNQLEYVKLITDRNLYLSGETIWFTAQCLLKETCSPSPLSHVLYIELFNSEKKSFNREKFSLTSGIASGNIQIPEELPSGNYFMRCYTQYLRNFPPETYPSICLTVINPETPLPQTGSIQQDSINLVPDGVSMIAGLPAEVGIRIPEHIMQKTNAFYVIDQNQHILGKIDPFRNGLAKFYFTPLDSMTYYLKTEFKDSSSFVIGFPTAMDKGYSLHAELTSSELICKIGYSQGMELTCDQIRLVIVPDGSEGIYDTDYFPFYKEQTKRIPIQNLVEGINYLALVDNNNQILQFKTLYLKKNEMINIPLLLVNDTCLPREQIDLELITPFSDNADTAILSVSVVPSGSLSTINTLLPYQFIENPGLIKPYLLNEMNPGIDLLDQIEVAAILKNKNSYATIFNRLNKRFTPFLYLPEIRDVSISGLVRDKKTMLPVSNIQVFVSVLFRNFQIHSTKTNEDGSFVFSLNSLTGNQDLYLYAEQNPENELELLIKSDFSVDFPEFSKEFYPPDSSSRRLIEELLVNHEVSQIFSTDTLIEIDPTRELPFLFGDEMTRVKPDDYIGLSTMKEVFNEIIPFVRLKEMDTHYQFSIFDKETGMLYKDPLILVDNIPLADPDEIMKIHPSQVEYIGIITGIYVLSNNTFHGIISIKTKTGDFKEINFPAGSVFAEYQTITSSSTISFPNYPTNQFSNKHNPDFRTLLYWNPVIKLASQNFSISFYSSDNCSSYDVILRGYTRSGKYCYGKASLKVVKEN
jgi:hypothetical protein